MRAVVITEPGGPGGAAVAGGARSGARRRARCSSRSRRPGVNRGRPDAAAGLLPAAAGRPAVPGAGVLGPDPGRGRPGHRLAARRRGVRAAGRRRVRGAGRRARRASCCPSRTRLPWSTRPRLPEAACTVQANVFQLARLTRGRDVPGARRGRRDRHASRSSWPRRSAPVVPAPRARRRSWPGAGSSARTWRSPTGTRISSPPSGLHRRARAPTSSSTSWAPVPGPEPGRAGRRAAWRSRHPGRQPGRARPRRADGQAGQHSCHRRCGPGPRQRRPRSWRPPGEHMWPLVSAGKVLPVIDRVLPMAQAAQAHRLIDARHAHREDPAGTANCTRRGPGHARPGATD